MLVSPFQSLMVLSAEPEARVPSVLQATLVTRAVCPVRVAVLVSPFQSLMVLSAEPEARVPSVLQATL